MTRLRALPHIDQWVFPSTSNPLNHFQSGEWSVTAVEHAWQKICRRVGLTGVRIHDLRRTAALWLSIHGENLQVIQSVLNHSSLASTQVYARLSVEPVRRALDEQATRMLGLAPSHDRRIEPQPAPVVSVCEPMQEWPGCVDEQRMTKLEWRAYSYGPDFLLRGVIESTARYSERPPSPQHDHPS